MLVISFFASQGYGQINEEGTGSGNPCRVFHSVDFLSAGLAALLSLMILGVRSHRVRQCGQNRNAVPIASEQLPHRFWPRRNWDD